MLEAMRIAAPGARFYQASSSEMYGLIQQPMQNEKTPSIRAALCGGQALWPLDHHELSRELRLARVVRHFVQP